MNENTVPTTEATEPSDSYTEPVATEVQTVIVQDLGNHFSDLIHVNLFGSFLVCGCLVACALFKGGRK